MNLMLMMLYVNKVLGKVHSFSLVKLHKIGICMLIISVCLKDVVLMLNLLDKIQSMVRLGWKGLCV